MIRTTAIGTVALAVATLATAAHSEPTVFMTKLTPEASVARNSTPIETRADGTGVGVVMYDPATDQFEFMLSFEGLVATDITTDPPSMDPQMRSGNNFNGAGLLVAHIHVGALQNNGPIPVDFVGMNLMDGRNGLADGIMATPNPIQMATQGMVAGRLNLRDLAARNMGMLQAGIPLDGPGPSMTDPGCLRCGFKQAIMTNNTYLNIHTFNNPFGEIRGQLVAQSCQIRSGVEVDQLIADLGAQLTAAQAQGGRIDSLTAALDGVRQAVSASDQMMARSFLSEFLGQVITDPASKQLSSTVVDRLVCGASELAAGLPLPPP